MRAAHTPIKLRAMAADARRLVIIRRGVRSKKWTAQITATALPLQFDARMLILRGTVTDSLRGEGSGGSGGSGGGLAVARGGRRR